MIAFCLSVPLRDDHLTISHVNRPIGQGSSPPRGNGAGSLMKRAERKSHTGFVIYFWERRVRYKNISVLTLELKALSTLHTFMRGASLLVKCEKPGIVILSSHPEQEKNYEIIYSGTHSVDSLRLCIQNVELSYPVSYSDCPSRDDFWGIRCLVICMGPITKQGQRMIRCRSALFN